MKYEFINKNYDLKNLIKQDSDNQIFLFENNFKNIDEVFNFLNSDKNLLLVSGFTGTGKNTVINKVLAYLNSETIVLNYTCFETTILDDILLSLFDEFKKLTSMGVIQPPKTKSENFTQKITSYFKSIDKPIIIKINSWQTLLKPNKPEILGFLSHLTSFKNIKIILVSKKFEIDNFEEKFIYKKISILAFEKHLFEKYIKSENVKLIGPISDEFYKYTKGYYFYTKLSIKIMQIRNLQLIDFLSGYTKSMLSFNDFILREALSLVDPVSGHLFRFLTIIRHPIKIELLKALNLYNEEKINFFVDNLILANLDNTIYLPDCYKEIAQNSIPDNIGVKIHKACIELYETQLPLKPLERNMMISRTTMRNEIEYHTTFVPQKFRLTQQATQNPQFAQFPKIERKKLDDSSHNKIQSQTEQSKQAIKNVSFIFEDGNYSALDNIADTIENFVKSSHENVLIEDEIKDLSLVELINFAKLEEKNFNYKKVIAICQRCLTMNSDDDFYTFLPTLYIKLATTYSKLSDWFSSLKYFEMTLEFFYSTGDINKAAEIKYEISNIYYITFKHDKAQNLLQDILRTDNIPNNLKIKTYLQLANISENKNNHIISENYYIEAMRYIDTTTEKAVLSELYYKLGAIYDEKSQFDKAIDLYKKCINIDNNYKNNPYLSSALTNISTICEEHDKNELAIKYCFESLEIDEKAQNNNGIYISSMKLASLYRKADFEKSVNYYKKAKAAAIELDEPFYIASSNIALGDYYFNKKVPDKAAECYFEAYQTAKTHFKEDNIAKISVRLNDVKIRLGETRYNAIINGMSKIEK